MSRRVLLLGSLAVGIAGSIGMVIGFAQAPMQAAFSYLTAWAFAVSIALGALIFLMIGHATNARWVIVFRNFTEAIVSSLPALAIGFIPIALSVALLYPWVDPSPALGTEALAKIAHKAPYLNVTFFVARAVAAFAIWIVISEVLLRWSARFGRNELRYGRKLRALSAGGLPVIGLTLTFAAFDWLMSLTPTWYSTIFGLLYFSGGIVAALALIAVITRGARRLPTVAATISGDHIGALGKLVLTFLCFWAYMEFSQGIIIWIANKPDEVPWYVARGAGAWGALFGVLIVGHFAIPFFALLPRGIKRRSRWLALIGVWLLAMHYVDVYWLVMPVLHRTIAVHWLDFAAPCAVLGLATACATARSRRPIADTDPRFASALRYEGS